MRLWRNNGLSIVLFLCFLVSFAGLTVTGHLHHNAEQRDHGEPPVGFVEYLKSPEFLEATMENWESEFLQMAAYVVLTAMLFQKGSAESKDPEKKSEPVDRKPDPKRQGAPGPVRRGGIVLALYKQSLFIVLMLLFFASFWLHAVGGARMYNNEQLQHQQPEVVSTLGYMATAQFWFESFQNWQSEFIAIFAIVVLTIFLRQHGSPESKPVDAAHGDTGNGG